MTRVDEIARHKLPHSTRILLRRELQRLERLLEEGEEVLSLAYGHFDGGNGLVALTSRRTLFVGRVLVLEERTFRSRLTDVPHRDVRKVASEARPLSGKITLSLPTGRIALTELTPRERSDEIAGYLRLRLKATLGGRRAPARQPALAAS